MDTIDTAGLLAATRTRCNRTQQYMARMMGKSLSTIQNWESGTSSPRLQDVWAWFSRLGVDPVHALLVFLHPNIYRIPISDTKKTDRALRHYVENIASERERQEMAFCLLCGNSWSAQLDLLTAFNRLPAKDRRLILDIIIDAYEMEVSSPDGIQPDIQNLRNEADRLMRTI